MKPLFIAAAVAVLALVVYAAVDCIQRKPRGWPAWVAFILLAGVGGVSLGWHSASVVARPLFILPLAAGFVRSDLTPAAAWSLDVTVPVGALAWLIWSGFKRKARVGLR